eukprot:758185-Hanusia_phi.AAC.13
MAAEGIGMAEVGVLKAKSLKRMDIAGLSDPYVVLSITGGGGWRKKTKKTKIIRNNLNPEWNQEFTFPVTDFEQKIELVVYDHDDLGSDDIMGYVIVPVSDFVDEDKEGWYTLLTKEREEIIGEDGSLSSVFLSFKYTAHASEEEIALSQDVYTGLAGGEDAIKDSIKKAAGSSPKRRILLQAQSYNTCFSISLFTFLRRLEQTGAVHARQALSRGEWSVRNGAMGREEKTIPRTLYNSLKSSCGGSSIRPYLATSATGHEIETVILSFHIFARVVFLKAEIPYAHALLSD